MVIPREENGAFRRHPSPPPVVRTRGAGLVPVGRSEDGLIEAIEREDGWFIGVQWHPEETFGSDPAQAALFGGLVEAAAARRAAARV